MKKLILLVSLLALSSQAAFSADPYWVTSNPWYSLNNPGGGISFGTYSNAATGNGFTGHSCQAWLTRVGSGTQDYCHASEFGGDGYVSCGGFDLPPAGNYYVLAVGSASWYNPDYISRVQYNQTPTFYYPGNGCNRTWSCTSDTFCTKPFACNTPFATCDSGCCTCF